MTSLIGDSSWDLNALMRQNVKREREAPSPSGKPKEPKRPTKKKRTSGGAAAEKETEEEEEEKVE